MSSTIEKQSIKSIFGSGKASAIAGRNKPDNFLFSKDARLEKANQIANDLSLSQEDKRAKLLDIDKNLAVGDFLRSTSKTDQSENPLLDLLSPGSRRSAGNRANDALAEQLQLGKKDGDAWLNGELDNVKREDETQLVALFDDNDEDAKTRKANEELISSLAPKDRDELQTLADQLGINIEDMNEDFLQEFSNPNIGVSGEATEWAGGGGQVNAGSVNTERSFNPLNNITETEDGLEVKSLNAFFKVKDIQDSESKQIAQGLGNYTWATLSRAWGEMFSDAYDAQGKSKEENLTATAEAMAKTAKLFENTDFYQAKGDKNNDANTNGLAMSFMFAYTGIQEDKLEGLTKDFTAEQKEKLEKAKDGDNVVTLSELVKIDTSLVEDTSSDRFKTLQDIVENASKDEKLNQFREGVLGKENLSKIKENTLTRVNERLNDEKDQIMEKLAGLDENQGKSEAELKSQFEDIYNAKIDGDGKVSVDQNAMYKRLDENGFKGTSYQKVENSEAVAQTYMNLVEMDKDLERLDKGDLKIDESSKNRDENRLFRADQVMVRYTPKGSDDHNGAFNEINSGRRVASAAGSNRDVLGQFIMPANGKEHFKDFVDGLNKLDRKISYYDESLHGNSSGTTAFNKGSKDVHKAMEDATYDGAIATLNSCLTGQDMKNGYAATKARETGMEVAAATVSTIGYQEHAYYDAETGQFGLTPVKLDGKTGGTVSRESKREESAENRGLKVNHFTSYLGMNPLEVEKNLNASDTAESKKTTANTETSSKAEIDNELGIKTDDNDTSFIPDVDASDGAWQGFNAQNITNNYDSQDTIEPDQTNFLSDIEEASNAGSDLSAETRTESSQESAASEDSSSGDSASESTDESSTENTEEPEKDKDTKHDAFVV